MTMTTVQKAKAAWELAALLENTDLKEQFLTLPSGDVAYELLQASIEARLEELMGGQNATVQELSAASQEVAAMVDNIKDLQQSLMEMVQKALGSRRPATAAQVAPQVPVARQRSRGFIPIELPTGYDPGPTGAEPLDMPTDIMG